MNHENCWTNITENMPVKVHTLAHNVYRDRGYIFGSIEVKAPTANIIHEFLHKFKNSNAIKEIYNILPINVNKKIYQIFFKEKYDGMISSILYENGVIYQNDYIENNVETVNALIRNQSAKDLKSELSKIGEIKKFTLSEINYHEYYSDFFELTEQERTIIYTAFMNGYYSMPRRLYLKDLEKMTGISKSALEEYIRKGTEKIIHNWINSNIPILYSKDR